MHAFAQKQNQSQLRASLNQTRKPQFQQACTCGGEGPKCQVGQGVYRHLQAKHVQPNDPGEIAAPLVHEVLRSPGQPLDMATRSFMEPRFGHDFSRVRVHTDAKAAASVRAVGARAYTVNQHIVFNSEEFAPGTDDGTRLLAHELTHTIQQRGSSNPVAVTISSPSDSAEVEADHVADMIYESFLTRQRSHIQPVSGGKEYKTPTISQLSSHPILYRVPCQSNPGLGRSEPHFFAESWFLLTHLGSGTTYMEYGIPESGRTGGEGYADIVHMHGRFADVYEVKQPHELAEGVEQLNARLVLGHLHCGRRLTWRAGTNYSPALPPVAAFVPGEHGSTRNTFITAYQSPTAGIVFWQELPRPEARSTRRVYVRRAASIRQRLANLDPRIGLQPEDQAQGQEGAHSQQPAAPPQSAIPVLTHLEPGLGALRQAAEQALRSPNLPAADNYLLLAPPDFYEQYVRLPRRAAVEDAVRRAYEVQNLSTRVNPIVAAHRIGIGILSLHAALTAAAITAAVAAPTTLAFAASPAAVAVLESLSSAAGEMAAAARAILPVMRNPQLAATTAGAVMYVASFREVQAQNMANQPPQLESLRLVRFAPDSRVRITYRSQSETQAGVHVFYEGEHYLVVGRAQRPGADQ